ncbi:MAG: hypothetical protein ACXQTD_00300 [Candidatus Syntropharchaeia archaeon]
MPVMEDPEEWKMDKDRKEVRCPKWFKTMKMEVSRCTGKIVRKEPCICPEPELGKIGRAQLVALKELKGGFSEPEDLVSWWIYECEYGHRFVRAVWWADVEVVPPGTIKTRPIPEINAECGWAMPVPKWYDPEKEKKWEYDP